MKKDHLHKMFGHVANGKPMPKMDGMDDMDEDSAHETPQEEKQEMKYCHQCGAKLTISR